MEKNKLISIIISVLAAALILTGSIAVPLICPQFYYAHIQPMKLTEAVGMTEAQIREAYDDVMDFCMGRTEVFSAGGLEWSAEGAAHFADVRKLFLLDIRLAVVCGILLAAVFLFCRWKQVTPERLRGHRPGFWAAMGLGIFFAAAGTLAALDFDRAFVVFHTLFFPGKDNWILDYDTDPVIYILPQEFFRNCAILIVAVIFICCTVLVVLDFMERRRRRG